MLAIAAAMSLSGWRSRPGVTGLRYPTTLQRAAQPDLRMNAESPSPSASTEEVSVGSGTHQCQVTAALGPDQQPVRFEVALPIGRPCPRQLVRPIATREFLTRQQCVDGSPELVEILPTLADPFDVPLESGGGEEAHRSRQTGLQILKSRVLD